MSLNTEEEFVDRHEEGMADYQAGGRRRRRSKSGR